MLEVVGGGGGWLLGISVVMVQCWFYLFAVFFLIQGLCKVSEYKEACCRHRNKIPRDVGEC